MQENYNWDTGTWYEDPTGYTTCSAEVLAYYLDPRNFIRTDKPALMFQFFVQSYDAATQTKEMLTGLVAGTFLAETYEYDENDPSDSRYKGSYTDVIMAAAEESGVNPLVLAATILKEQGVNGTSPLISGTYEGYEGYYNFFNYAASGSDVIGNGLSYAKKQGWSSRALSIIGGATMYGEGYIRNNQFTFYYKDFNVLNKEYWHQYAQLVYDQVSSAYILARAMQNTTDAAHVFHIPVYDNMPSELCEYPAENDLLNNYYILGMDFEGLSGTFDKYTYDYNASVSGDTTVTLTLPATAVYGGQSSYSLAKGSNTIELTVWSESGYSRTYTLTIQANKNCTLIIETDTFTPQSYDISEYSIALQDINTSGGLCWTAYTGSEIKPRVSVSSNGAALTEGVDYILSYENNTNVGEASVTITGTGRYTGTARRTFLITFKDVPATHNYRKAVYWAVDEGIAAGYSGDRSGIFGVNDSITRGQVIMFLWRAAGKPEASDLSSQSFSDVGKKSAFYKAIQWAVEEGIAAGYKDGTFRPSEICTRGQIALFLWRYAGKPALQGGAQTFTDVPASHNFYKAVQWAYENGITAGYPDGSFGVNRSCTRSAAFIVNPIKTLIVFV